LASGAAWLSRDGSLVRGNSLGLAPGVQLWSVREQIKNNLDGTLQHLAAIGYREVELFETPKSPGEFRKKVEDAGLKCVSGHFELKDLKDPATIAAAQALGLTYMILVFPALPSLEGRSVDANFEQFVPLYEKISLSDYKWNADQLNRCAENLKRQGIRTGYHNHAIDFKNFGGTRGFDALLQNTDPNLVCFEMDCGHVIHAGHDPIAYLNKYPTRIELLHIKDLVPGYHVSTTLDTEDKDTNAEIGFGSIDWKKLFETAARYGRVKHYFVEHEGKMAHPPLEALQISYNYLQKLQVN
ncbi:MAG TPA: sugar phosphate isomerase/epimerase, partial [Candidatus Angelobacter sp.]